MTADKIDSLVLKRNLKKLLLAIDIKEGEDSLIRIVNASFANLANFPYLGVYEDSFANLVNDFSIPKEISEKHKINLEQSASLYLKLYPYHLRPLVYAEYMERLKRIAKYSTYLKNEIANADHRFFEFLTLANHFEKKEDDEPLVHEFFNSLGQSLVILEQLEQGVRNSYFGKGIGIGTPSKKRNWALYNWVYSHYNMWTVTLNRTMQRDKTGLGGRKRFLEYLDRLMAPLHPEMCSHRIDLSEVRTNPVTNDAMDSVLKAIQKEIKECGKNDT